LIFLSDTMCLLFAEFDSNLAKSMIDLGKTITCAKIIKTLTKKKDITKWWNIRNSALGFSLRRITFKTKLASFN